MRADKRAEANVWQRRGRSILHTQNLELKKRIFHLHKIHISLYFLKKNQL